MFVSLTNLDTASLEESVTNITKIIYVKIALAQYVSVTLDTPKAVGILEIIETVSLEHIVKKT